MAGLFPCFPAARFSPLGYPTPQELGPAAQRHKSPTLVSQLLPFRHARSAFSREKMGRCEDGAFFAVPLLPHSALRCYRGSSLSPVTPPATRSLLHSALFASLDSLTRAELLPRSAPKTTALLPRRRQQLLCGFCYVFVFLYSFFFFFFFGRTDQVFSDSVPATYYTNKKKKF